MLDFKSNEVSENKCVPRWIGIQLGLSEVGEIEVVAPPSPIDLFFVGKPGVTVVMNQSETER